MSRAERDAFWNRPEMAQRMGDRPPDHRLVRLLADTPTLAPVLDVGCAGGRNTAYVAEQGIDVVAFDAAATMVEATRARLAPLLGPGEAASRVRTLDLEHLAAASLAPFGPFGLVLALGVLQDLPDERAFRRALSVLHELTRPGGRMLVANFGPDSQPQGAPLHPVEGAPHTYLGFGPLSRRMTLPDAATLDAWVEDAGFDRVEATEVKRSRTESGYRTTLNGSYRKRMDHEAQP